MASDDDLDATIARVYGGPLDDFIRRRDAIAKELRTAGDRDGATAIKSLRKPSRTAWALDMAALENEDALDDLIESVNQTIAAQGSGGDARAALAQLRAAVRAFAAHAADVAEHAGYPLDAGTLANEVLAVLGEPASFDLLRHGRLADTPDAGGLDFLTALAASGTPVAGIPSKRRHAPAAAPSLPDTSQLENAAREAAHQAILVVAKARERADSTHRAFRDAETKVHMAEARVRDAEEAARIARAERDHARETADAAAAQLQTAERALAKAEQRAKDVGNS